MASNDYDDLLQSFMNNSQKVYNDDKDNHDKLAKKLPASYSVNKSRTKADKKARPQNAPKAAKKKNNKAPKPAKTTNNVKRFFSLIGKAILAALMIAGVVTVVCSSVIFIYGYTFVQGDKVFDLDKEKYSQNQTSFIYGYDSSDKLIEITRLHGEENRIWLSLDEMNPNLANAFIAIEDERFYTHHGVDWKRVGGVIVNQSGQGGSTITQQLIKNLTDQNDVTFVRKFNEILSALNLEKHYSKDQIIEAYLNTIYLSHGCYGVRTAAETYFGKEVKDLNIAECACLAAITKAPTRYDPLLNEDQINPANGVSRREWIIKKMRSLGLINDEEMNEALNYKMIYTTSKDYKGSQIKSTKKSSEDTTVYSYYTDYVIEEVLSDLQKMGYSSKKANNLLFGGGLKIYTAIDFDIQAAMDDVYVNYRKMPDETVEGSCVVMDYKGRVLGIVGGTGKKTGRRELNRASQSERQPGSTIKPLSVYGPALEKSLNDPETEIYWSTPTKDAPLMEVKGKMWPTNEGGGYSGDTITVQKGLAQSKNTISARTLEAIGPSYSYEFMVNRWHITSLDVRDEDYAPMATGSLTHGVSVLEMTTAYQAFGNGGYYYEPYGYYKIEDSQGNVIIEKKPEDTKETALSENTAGVMNKLLQTVMTEGTGRSYKLSSMECFGKTGTTTESKDRWFIGGTPEYVCGVWYGYDKPKEIKYYLSANPCGTIWNLVMNNIYDVKDVNETEFEIPEGVVRREFSPTNGKLCKGSGMYGWFDENNLPGYTTYVKPTEKDKKEDGDSKKNKAEGKKEATTSANENGGDTAAAEAPAEQTEAPPVADESPSEEQPAPEG